MSNYTIPRDKLESRVGSGIGIKQSRSLEHPEFDPKDDRLVFLASAIGSLAEAINRLAATQEHPKSKGAVSFSTASYDDQPDPQTAQLREIAKKRSESDNS